MSPWENREAIRGKTRKRQPNGHIGFFFYFAFHFLFLCWRRILWKFTFLLLFRFLPRLAASSLEKILNDSGIHVQKDSSEQELIEAIDFVCEFSQF